jgi:hypothetical protein
MFMRDYETWMWLTDSGANHHMTSMRGDNSLIGPR